MKKIRILSAILAVCLMVSMFAGCKKETPLVTVNGETLTAEDYAMYQLAIEGMMLDYAGITIDQASTFFSTTDIEGKNAGDYAKEKAMEQAVLSTVLCQKAKESGITITDEDRKEIEYMIEAEITQLGGRDKFDKRLKEMGTNLDSFRKFLETDCIVTKYHDVIYAMPECAVADAEVIEKINTIYVKAKHILLMTVDELNQPYPDEQKQGVKEQIDNLYQQIINGADFDKLMNEYCQDPGLETSPEGYIFTKGQMVPEFETASYALQIGEVSEPVETVYGYHIIKREAFTDEDINVYFESALQLVQAEKVNKVYERFRNAANVQINQEKLAQISLVSTKIQK